MKLKKLYVAQLTKGISNQEWVTKITNRVMNMTPKQVKAEMIILYGEVLTSIK